MRRIGKRAWVLLLLILVLAGGTALYVRDYARNAHSWVMHPGNGHIYQGSQQLPARGSVVDREGMCLLQLQPQRSYGEDPMVRMSTLHWLGDRAGNIQAPALAHYQSQLSGYDDLNGLYSYSGTGGVMTLTLSHSVQQAALEALGAYKGTVAVYNYKTGELLCAVSTPTFDPDHVPDIAGQPDLYDGVYLNRFTQGVYIPGSIFKVVTTAAALEHADTIAHERFQCTGVLEFGTDKVTCEIPHGTLDLKTAMQRSCNCAYAQVAMLLGQEVLLDYAARFGVLDKLQFDGITTAQGSMDRTELAPVELAWTAIGQHKDQINPCTFLTFIGAVAAGGQGVSPYVVSSISQDGAPVYVASTEQRQRIMSTETALQLQQYMRNNVVNNYGDSHFPGLTVCAKSGTGEVDGDQLSYAMFTGFTMDEAYPLAFIVAVEDAGYGKTVCVPILAQVLAACKEMMDAETVS